MEIFFRFQIIRENILYINCNYSRKFSFFLFFFLKKRFEKRVYLSRIFKNIHKNIFIINDALKMFDEKWK